MLPVTAGAGGTRGNSGGTVSVGSYEGLALAEAATTPAMAPTGGGDAPISVLVDSGEPTAALGAGAAPSAVEPSKADGAHVPYGEYLSFSSGVIPEARLDNKKLGIPLGVLLSPIQERDGVAAGGAASTSSSAHAAEYLRRTPVACSVCNAIVGRYTVVDMRDGTWQCLFCGSYERNTHFAAAPVPPSAVDAAVPSGAQGDTLGAAQQQLLRGQYPELIHDVVDFIDPSAQPSVVRSMSGRAVIFVIDEHLPRPAMENIRESVANALQSLSNDCRVGLVTFSSVVRIYELGLSASLATSCNVFPGAVLGEAADIEAFVMHQSRYLVPLKHCKENIAQAMVHLVESSRPLETRRKSSSTPQLRAFGTAIDYAMHLGENDGRMLCFLSGAPSFGPGAIQIDNSGGDELREERAKMFYRERALRAQRNGCCIDVFCIGARQFGVTTLNCLVLSNAGTVLLVRDHADRQLSKNVHLALHRHLGLDGRFSIRTSPGLSITHVIGPAVPSKSKNDKVHVCLMGGVQTRFSFAIYFDVTSNIVDEFVHFQIVAEFTTFRNERVSRIINARLPAKKRKPFVDSVNAEVTAVLMAKKLVLEARKTDPEDMVQVLDDLDHKARSLVQKCSNSASPELWAGFGGGLPRSLTMIPRYLFLLRRGSMLGPILQHLDDIDPIRCLFLQRDADTCRRLIAPELYRATPSGLQSLPLETLAMQSTSVLLMDNHTDIFIWLGRGVTAETHGALIEQCQRYAESVAADRFPQPYIMTFKEGSSMARWLACRLIPSHKDTAEQQLVSFPLLKELSEPDRRVLLGKFHHTDDLSYCQYWEQIIEGEQ